MILTGACPKCSGDLHEAEGIYSWACDCGYSSMADRGELEALAAARKTASVPAQPVVPKQPVVVPTVNTVETDGEGEVPESPEPSDAVLPVEVEKKPVRECGNCGEGTFVEINGELMCSQCWYRPPLSEVARSHGPLSQYSVQVVGSKRRGRQPSEGLLKHEETLHRMYPQRSKEDILAAIPYSWHSIQKFASQLGVKRLRKYPGRKRPLKEAVYCSLCDARLVVGESESERECPQCGWKAPSRTRQCPVCQEWFAPKLSQKAKVVCCSRGCADRLRVVQGTGRGPRPGQRLQAKECEWCGKEFQPKLSAQRFCKQQCGAKANGAKQKAEKSVAVTCEVCGTESVIQRSQVAAGHGRSCSMSCRGVLGARALAVKRGILQPKVCEGCGSSFQPRNARQRFCGKSCACRANGATGGRKAGTPYRRAHRLRHYLKTAAKIDEVISLYNSGLGIRKVATKVGLAPNTVKGIIHEAAGVNKEAAAILRKKQHDDRGHSVTRALKGIASSDKHNGYTLTAKELCDRATAVLVDYLDRDPKVTVLALLGDKAGVPFMADHLIEAAVGVVISQALRLDDSMVEISPGVFKKTT